MLNSEIVMREYFTVFPTINGTYLHKKNKIC